VRTVMETMPEVRVGAGWETIVSKGNFEVRTEGTYGGKNRRSI